MRIKGLLAVGAAAALLLSGCATGGGTASAPSDAPKVDLGRIEIIAPANPGSGWDQTARAFQAALDEAGVVSAATVTNVPGASGTVALAQVAPQTGKKNLLIMSGLAMMSGIITNATPASLDDLTPIARLIGDSEVIVVPKGSPYTTLDELFAAIKKDPASVPIAGGSAGSADQLFIGLLAQAYEVDPTSLNYVPYSGGGEATTALLGNQVAAGIAGLGEFLQPMQSGDLTGLVISSTQVTVPDVEIPTIADAGFPDLEFTNWRSVMAPGGITPEETQAYIDAVDQMSQTQAWKDVLAQNLWADNLLTGEEFGTWLKDENTRVGGILKDLGLAS